MKRKKLQMSDNENTNSSMHPQADMQKLTNSMSAIGKKILVLSGKGGVGKSTVAVNIAAELADKGYATGLLDVDLHGPSVPRMTGNAGRKTFGTDEKLLPVKISDNFQVMSIAFLLPDDTQATIWRGPMKYSIIQKMLADTEWGRLDYLVIDAPPGTGDEPLSVAQLVGSNSGAVLVTTPQQVATEDVRRCITFCQQLSLPVWGIVENMSGFLCPHCNKQVDIFTNKSGGLTLAEETDTELLGRLPITPQIAEAADDGVFINSSQIPEQARQNLNEIIENLLKNIDPNTDQKGSSIMKIAIPTAERRLCMHFGHCEQFAFVSVDPETKAITGTDYLTPPPHEPGVIPKWVADNGGTLVIAGGMGQRAVQIFNQHNVDVVVGAAPDSPENIVAAYLSGSLQTGQNACDH